MLPCRYELRVRGVWHRSVDHRRGLVRAREARIQGTDVEAAGGRGESHCRGDGEVVFSDTEVDVKSPERQGFCVRTLDNTPPGSLSGQCAYIESGLCLRKSASKVLDSASTGPDSFSEGRLMGVMTPSLDILPGF